MKKPQHAASMKLLISKFKCLLCYVWNWVYFSLRGHMNLGQLSLKAQYNISLFCRVPRAAQLDHKTSRVKEHGPRP